MPSRPLRDLIARATEDGRDLEGKVIAFTDVVYRAVTGFDHEVGPLHLPDADYHSVAVASGLQGLLTLAHRMETALGEAVSAA